MEKFANFLDKYLSPIADKMSNIRILRAIADGMIGVMPLTMVAAIFSVINSLPTILPFLPDWSETASSWLLMPYNLLFGVLALIISYTVANRYAKNFDLNQVNAGIMSLILFVIVANCYDGSGFDGTYLGYAGIFTAVIVALTSVKLYALMVKYRITIRMPDSVPPLVSDSFNTMVPMFLEICLYYGISTAVINLTGNCIPAWINVVVMPALQGGDSITYQVLLHLFMQLFFWLGMHGWAILGGIIVPIQTSLLAENAAAAAAGEALPYFTAGGVNMMGTFWWFLPLMYMFLCKSERMKSLGKVTLVPALFGISEPLTFGSPIVLNPILGIPFILFQPIVVGINMAAVKLGFMVRSAVSTVSGIPQPFATWLACDGDFRVFLVFIICVVVCVAIWYPFVVVWDRKCLREEAATKASHVTEKRAEKN